LSLRATSSSQFIDLPVPWPECTLDYSLDRRFFNAANRKFCLEVLTWLEVYVRCYWGFTTRVSIRSVHSRLPHHVGRLS
jgi:hypothetical protein